MPEATTGGYATIDPVTAGVPPVATGAARLQGATARAVAQRQQMLAVQQQLALRNVLIQQQQNIERQPRIAARRQQQIRNNQLTIAQVRAAIEQSIVRLQAIVRWSTAAAFRKQLSRARRMFAESWCRKSRRPWRIPQPNASRKN